MTQLAENLPYFQVPLMTISRTRSVSRPMRLTQTQVLAPDDGTISTREATVGAVLPARQEMFRLIRQGRLE